MSEDDKKNIESLLAHEVSAMQKENATEDIEFVWAWYDEMLHFVSEHENISEQMLLEAFPINENITKEFIDALYGNGSIVPSKQVNLPWKVLVSNEPQYPLMRYAEASVFEMHLHNLEIHDAVLLSILILGNTHIVVSLADEEEATKLVRARDILEADMLRIITITITRTTGHILAHIDISMPPDNRYSL